jgi:hypothetical protein
MDFLQALGHHDDGPSCPGAARSSRERPAGYDHAKLCRQLADEWGLSAIFSELGDPAHWDRFLTAHPNVRAELWAIYNDPHHKSPLGRA